MLLTAIQSVREAASRLEKAVCSREELTVIVEAPGGTPSAAYIKYELQQARVTSFAVSGAHDGSPRGGSHPIEEISMNYTKVEGTYDPTGEVYCFDCPSGYCIFQEPGDPAPEGRP